MSITQVPLSRQQFALIDSADAEAVLQHRWCAKPSPHGGFYALRNQRDANGKYRIVYMHRELMAPAAGFQVDHINGDKLDNRRINLRVCIGQENSRNRGPSRINKSGFKGVSFHAGALKWQARIDGRHLGLFLTAEDAAARYDQAARVNHGAFASLNFPEVA